MENKDEKVGISMKDSSNIVMKNVRTVGYDKGIQVENTSRLVVDDFKSVKNLNQFSTKWYKDLRFLTPIIVSIAVAVVSWIYFS